MNNNNKMKTFKTKLKNKKNVVDELQYVRHGDQAPNAFVENAPKEKQSNLNPSDLDAISGGQYIPIKQDQLSGEGVNIKEVIEHEIEEVGRYPADARSCQVDQQSPFGEMESSGYRRVFKKDNVIYDLTSNEPLR